MTASSSSHTFACHRCRQQLVLPPSLCDDVASGGALTQSAYDVIEAEHASARGTQRQQSRDGNSLSSHLALTTSLFDLLSSTTPSDSWTPPAKSSVTSATDLRKANHEERKRAARLPLGKDNELIAAIDHPLCAECTNILLSVMDGQLDELRRERDAYLAFEDEMRKREARRLSKEEEDEESEHETLETVEQSDIDNLIKQAEDAQRELIAAQRDAELVEGELRTLQAQEESLEREETQFWQLYSDLQRDASHLSNERTSLQTSLAHDRAQLNRLELTNVYNDAFAIGYDGGYATINGLRLGRLPGDGRAIDWQEINAAWGQTAFLLVTLARKLDFEFKNYQIHPIGSFSTVERVGTERREIYELHGSNEWQLGRLLTDRRFDHAMVAFLDCLDQLCRACTALDQGLKLPHAISRDKIGGASIRLQFGSDEIWTRALRNVLMTLKIILAWSIRDDREGHINTQRDAGEDDEEHARSQEPQASR